MKSADNNDDQATGWTGHSRKYGVADVQNEMTLGKAFMLISQGVCVLALPRTQLEGR